MIKLPIKLDEEGSAYVRITKETIKEILDIVNDLLGEITDEYLDRLSEKSLSEDD
jgi:hypothetical protein